MAQRPAGYWKNYYQEHREQRISESVAYQQRNREARAEYQREYARANPEKFRRTPEQQAEYNRKRRERYATDSEFRERVKQQAKGGDPEVKRNTRLLKQFGITAAQYDDMLAQQDGRCAICRAEFSDRRGHRLAVDHCHETGVVRGLLCANCNQGIGKFGDRPDLLDGAALYLRSRQRSSETDQ